MAFFLYEDERGQIQNRLEELWVSIDDKARNAMSKNTAFLHEIVSIVTATFERFFGRKLFSWQALGVSICYSMTSLGCTFVLSFFLPKWFPGHADRSDLGLWFVVVAFFGGLGTLPAIIGGRLRLAAWLAAIFAGMCAYMAALPLLECYWDCLPYVVAGLFLGVASDFLLLATNRWVLQWSLSESRPLGLLSILIVNVILGLALFVPTYLFPPDIWRGYFSFETELAIEVTCFSNLAMTVIAFLIVLSTITLLLHRLSWPFISRPLYAASRFALIRNSKLLGTLGIICLLGAFPGSTILHRLKELL